MRKFVRRHRTTFAVGSGALGLLLVGLIATSWQALRAVRAEREQSYLRQQAEQARSDEVKLRKQAQEALNSLSRLLATQGKPTEIEAASRHAVATVQKLQGTDSSHTADMLQSLGYGLYASGKVTEAEAMYREVLALRKRTKGSKLALAQTLNGLGYILFWNDKPKFADAEICLREALAIRRTLSNSEPADLAITLHNLGYVLWKENKLVESERSFREAVSMRKKLFGTEHLEYWNSLLNLTSVLLEQDKFSEAEPLIAEQVEILRERLPADSPELASTLAMWVLSLLPQERFGEAEIAARECLDIRERKLPEDWCTFNAQSLLGGALAGQRRFAEAEALLLSGYVGLHQRQARIPLGARVRLREALDRLVRLYENWGKSDEAQEWRKKLEAFEGEHQKTSHAQGQA